VVLAGLRGWSFNERAIRAQRLLAVVDASARLYMLGRSSRSNPRFPSSWARSRSGLASRPRQAAWHPDEPRG